MKQTEILYFDKSKDKNDEYSFKYKSWKNDFKLKDLFLFNPNNFNEKDAENIYEINKNIFNSALEISVINELNTDINPTNDTEDIITNYNKIFTDLDNNKVFDKDRITFLPNRNIDELISLLKKDLLDDSIDEMIISSGSVHPMRYSKAVDLIIKDGKEDILDKNMQNINWKIVYGPLVLLDDDGNNKFIKKLFDIKGNFSLFYDKSKYNRNHFIYKKHKDNKEEFIAETIHKECIINRNMILLKGINNTFDNIIKLDYDNYKKIDNIKIFESHTNNLRLKEY
ncbi:hypothetical protein, partial [Brachyspira pilosicoli]|uniref:hypothetical protein n=1 Tax=Brachyspira pilosicoli TaxID=52584 RepID=UPI001CA5BA25